MAKLIDSSGVAKEDVLVEVERDDDSGVVSFVRVNEGDTVPEELRDKPTQAAGERV